MYRHFCYSCPEDQKVCRCKTVVSTTYRPNLDKCRPVRRRSSLIPSCLRVYRLFLRLSRATTTSNSEVECHHQVPDRLYCHIRLESDCKPPLLWLSVELCAPLLYCFRPQREGWRQEIPHKQYQVLQDISYGWISFSSIDGSFRDVV